MCGIAGIVGSSLYRDATIASMVGRMSHRGPDDSSVWSGNGLALGHSRLAVLDLSEAGEQPMVDPDTGIVLTYNGEIYNWRDLRSELEGEGEKFDSLTDSEVLLKLYRRNGIACIERLEGMFAFGLWDPRVQVLHLVRDRYGVKPLLYATTHDGLVFASEIRCFESIETGGIDVEALACYVRTNYIPAPYTIYQNIRRLPPGHRMEVRPGSPSSEPTQWWDPVSEAKRPSRRVIDDPVEAIDSTLEQAVLDRLDADVPVGIFLSGGIDSGLIAAIAARHRPGVLTMSVSIPEVPAYDESERAALTAQHVGSTHMELRLTTDDCLESVEEVLEWIDEPFADASLIPTYLLSRAARKHVTVALSGDGGDELFGGYSKHLAARWAAMPLARGAGALLQEALHGLPDGRTSAVLNTLRKGKRLASGLTGTLEERQSRMVSMLTPEVARTVLKFDDSEALGIRVSEEVGRTVEWTDQIQRTLMSDVTYVLPYDMLEKVDRASMWNSLEVRSPFLDRRLLAVAFGVPGTRHVGLFTTKRLLREVAKRHLPPAITTAPKKGFGVPLGEWFNGPLRGLVEDALSPSMLRQVDILNPGVVRDTVEQHRSGRCDRSWELWNMIVLQRWAKRCL